MNISTTTHVPVETSTKATGRNLNPPFIPSDAQDMTIDVYAPAGSKITGAYTITVTTTGGDKFTTIVDGLTMVMMLGAFVSQKVEKEFSNLFTELQARNEVIDAIEKLMPIIVKLQTIVPPGGVGHTLTGADATTWAANAGKAGLPGHHQDMHFSQSDVTEVLDLLQNNLSNQTRAGEQQMMKLNTQASLRTTFYSLMQSNAGTFKQSLRDAAN